MAQYNLHNYLDRAVCYKKQALKTCDIITKAKNTVFPEIIESRDKSDISVQLALKGSIAFINYLYTNYDDILKDDFDLFEQCKNIVENGTLDALFTETNKK